jgi:hypothetical protein
MSLHKKVQTLSDLVFPYKITIQDSAVTDSGSVLFHSYILSVSNMTSCRNITEDQDIFSELYRVSDGSSDMETLDSDLATITAVHILLI